MKKKYYPLLIVVLSFIFFLVIFLVLHWGFAEKIAIDPPKLVEEYAKFLGNLVTVIAGFILINVFWEKFQQNEKTDGSRKIVRSLSCRIVSLCNEITRLSELVIINDNEASLQRDDNVQYLGQKLKTLGRGLENNLDNIYLLSEILNDGEVINICLEILSHIEKLNVGPNYRVELNEFKHAIAQICASTLKLINCI